MRYLFLALLLTSCAVTPPRPADPPAEMYANEWVITASGDWNCCANSSLRSSFVYPKGVYVIKEINGSISIKNDIGGLGASSLAVGESQKIPYDPSKDLCKEITQKGVSCSPNYVMRAY